MQDIVLAVIHEDVKHECRDCDFREEGSEKRDMSEWKIKR